MQRLYGSLAPDGRARAGLVLLDEAFSKMDEDRIQATQRFARELGLQLVTATPKERSELVAPCPARCVSATPLEAADRAALRRLRGQLTSASGADAPDVQDAVALLDTLLAHGVKVEQERY
jgi:hypothetical protein